MRNQVTSVGRMLTGRCFTMMIWGVVTEAFSVNSSHFHL